MLFLIINFLSNQDKKQGFILEFFEYIKSQKKSIFQHDFTYKNDIKRDCIKKVVNPYIRLIIKVFYSTITKL